MTELLSIRTYAKRRGCSHTAVAKAIRTGRLRVRSDREPTGSVVLVGGEKRIDPERADAEWTALTDVAQQRDQAVRRGGNPAGGNPETEVATVSTPDVRPTQGSLWGESERAAPSDKHGDDPTEKRTTYLEARTRREQFAAKRAEMEVRHRAGELVEAEQVRAAIFEAFRGARDLLAGMLERVTPQVAAESDPGKVRALLEREHDVALASIVELMERAGDGENARRT